MKILVFDPDQSLRELLRLYLAGHGHEVLAFKDPTLCPLYKTLHNERCRCPRDAPCGDVVIVDDQLPQISALDFFRLQRRRGCKALDANKAVMSSRMTEALEQMIGEFGCNFIRKPFRLASIKRWVDECRERLAQGQQGGAAG